ncbi:hypothetical protein HRbin07_00463 [bacterium HR07]|nr:hypothetical protein HRbin07_00463 [bacterium HR07]
MLAAGKLDATALRVILALDAHALGKLHGLCLRLLGLDLHGEIIQPTGLRPGKHHDAFQGELRGRPRAHNPFQLDRDRSQFNIVCRCAQAHRAVFGVILTLDGHEIACLKSTGRKQTARLDLHDQSLEGARLRAGEDRYFAERKALLPRAGDDPFELYCYRSQDGDPHRVLGGLHSHLTSFFVIFALDGDPVAGVYADRRTLDAHREIVAGAESYSAVFGLHVLEHEGVRVA